MALYCLQAGNNFSRSLQKSFGRRSSSGVILMGWNLGSRTSEYEKGWIREHIQVFANHVEAHRPLS